MEASAISRHFEQAGGRRTIMLADRTYACPKESWLLGDFYRFFRSELFRLGVGAWHQQHDCDDYARAYAMFAQIAHFRTQKNLLEGMAVGEVFYFRNGLVSAGHAINVAFVGADNPIYIEPQTGKRTQLNQFERDSIWFVRF